MLTGELLISGGTNWDLVGRKSLPKGGIMKQLSFYQKCNDTAIYIGRIDREGP